MEYDPTNPTDDTPSETPPATNIANTAYTTPYYDYSYYYNYYNQQQQNYTTGDAITQQPTPTTYPQGMTPEQIQYASYYAGQTANNFQGYYPYYTTPYAQPYVNTGNNNAVTQRPPKKNNNNSNNNNGKENLKRKRQEQEISAILKRFKVKIPSDESPEEIAKWIEDRRKNFPTKENIEKKKTHVGELNGGERPPRGERNRDKYNKARNNADKPKRQRICTNFLKNKRCKRPNCKFLHEQPKNLRPVVTPKRPPTLLQKLLDDTIQQEAQILLQCLVYIKQNNFFSDYSPEDDSEEIEDDEEDVDDGDEEDINDNVISHSTFPPRVIQRIEKKVLEGDDDENNSGSDDENSDEDDEDNDDGDDNDEDGDGSEENNESEVEDGEIRG